MKSLIATICILGIVGLIAGTMVSAATEATITATVTVQSIAVSVADGTIAYGTLGQNSTADTNPDDTQTATNNGNVTENFNIKAIADASTPDWTIGATAAPNVYVHQFCISTCGTPPTNYTPLTTSYQTLATGIAAEGNQTFDLYINTPNTSTVYTVQSVDVIVQAIAG